MFGELGFAVDQVAEGLDSWDGYLAKLAGIAARTEAPKRSVAILPRNAAEESACC